MPNPRGYTNREEIPSFYNIVGPFQIGDLCREGTSTYRATVNSPDRDYAEWRTMSVDEIEEALRPEGPLLPRPSTRPPFIYGRAYRRGDIVQFEGHDYRNIAMHADGWCRSNITRQACWRRLPDDLSQWQPDIQYAHRVRVTHNGAYWYQNDRYEMCLGHEPSQLTSCWHFIADEPVTAPEFDANRTGHFVLGENLHPEGVLTDTYVIIAQDGARTTYTRRNDETTAQFYDRVHATNFVLGLYLNGDIPADYPYTTEDQVVPGRPSQGLFADPEPQPVEHPDAEPVFEPVVEEHVILPFGKQCPCDGCKLSAGQPASLLPGSFVDYNYEPAVWSLHKVENDPDDWYLGVELETDNVKGIVNSQTAIGMARPADLWIAKRDGSVSGPEFVSDPCTLAYWRTQYDNLEEMMGMLLHAGFRGHDGAKAGLHTNISRTAFTDKKHLYRFLTLSHHDPAWTLTMSQRNRHHASSMANMTALSTKEGRQQTVSTNRNIGGRHVSINFGNANRIEFRLPRGTLRIDRFFKTIEWVHAMVQYTREAPLFRSTPKEFTKWVQQHAAEYPYLWAFMREKLGVGGLV